MRTATDCAGRSMRRASQDVSLRRRPRAACRAWEERVLRTLGGVEGAAAVSEPDVEPPVGTERQLAAIVVLLRLIHAQQFSRRACRRGTRRHACSRLCRSSAGRGGGCVAKSGWNATPSNPCSAPTSTRSPMSTSGQSSVPRAGAQGVLSCSRTHSASGSPGALPSQVGPVEPGRDPLEVEVMGVAGSAGRGARFDRVADVAVGTDGDRREPEQHRRGRGQEEHPSHSRRDIRRT